MLSEFRRIATPHLFGIGARLSLELTSARVNRIGNNVNFLLVILYRGQGHGSQTGVLWSKSNEKFNAATQPALQG